MCRRRRGCCGRRGRSRRGLRCRLECLPVVVVVFVGV